MRKIKQDKLFCTMIVEDSPLFRETLTEVIHQHFPGIQIESVGDGNIVMEKVGEYHPDVILMDIKLPGIDGITLTRSIKHSGTGVVIVMLSSNDMPEYRQEAFKSGADCFISKGASSCMNDVIARLEGVLNTRGCVIHH